MTYGVAATAAVDIPSNMGRRVTTSPADGSTVHGFDRDTLDRTLCGEELGDLDIVPGDFGDHWRGACTACLDSAGAAP